MEKNLARFDTLRGLLALWILMGHLLLRQRYGSIYDAGFARLEDFHGLGELSLLHFLSVDIFFVLSGLVLALRYGPKVTNAMRGRDIDRFYLRRLWRIWPLHAAMVAIIGMFHLTGVPHPISSGLEGALFEHWQWTLAVNLLLMNAWGIMPVASWNEPAWALSIFFLLYVIFPNLLLGLKRLPKKPMVYAVAGLTLIVGYAALRDQVPLGSHSDGAGAIARGLVFFTIGCLTALYANIAPRGFWERHGLKIGFGFFVMVVFYTYIEPFPLTLFHLTYAPLLLGLLHNKRRLVPLCLASWLGSRSFAIFMTHYPALLLMRHAMGSDLAAAAAQGPAEKLFCYGTAIGLCLLAAELAARLDDRLHRRKIASY